MGDLQKSVKFGYTELVYKEHWDIKELNLNPQMSGLQRVNMDIGNTLI